MSKATERIQSLREQIKKEMAAVRTELAKQLDAACKTYKLLIELGDKDVWRDPQYAEYVAVLGIGGKPDEAKATGTRAPKGSLKTAILEILSSHAMTHKDIKAELEKKMGKASNQFNLLDKLVKEKVLSKSGSGKSATYKASK
jgi:hypothetical protein